MAEALRVRAAQAGDAAAIAAIWRPIILETVITFHPHPREAEEVAAMIAARQGAGHAFLVAEGAAGVVGFASYAQFRVGPGYARTMEHTVNLAPAARGQGVGARLVSGLVEHATRAGHRSLIGAVTAANAGSRAFHRRMGFVEVGLIPEAGWKFGRFHDLVLMRRALGVACAGDSAGGTG
ncbi:MAG: N-acetyltransferase family protein [Alkalilacustris sp.]